MSLQGIFYNIEYLACTIEETHLMYDFIKFSATKKKLVLTHLEQSRN